MADNQITENDEDDIVIIEGEAPVEEAATEDADDSDDDEDEDEEDYVIKPKDLIVSY